MTVVNEGKNSVKSNNTKLNDVDIIIPVYIDFDDRMRNLQSVLNYIDGTFADYNIIIVEMESDKCMHLSREDIEYYNIQEPFNKTRAINIGLEKCTRKFVSVWDVDCILSEKGIKAVLEELRATHGKKIAYPYNGWFLDVKGGTLDMLQAKPRQLLKSIFVYDQQGQHGTENITVRYSTRSRRCGGGNNGGCVFFDRAVLNELGNYNENFYCWGFEDDEIDQRFEIMGYRRFNAPDANCYHMDHKRVDSASIHGQEFWKINEAEFKHVTSMHNDKLASYIDNDFIVDVKDLTIMSDVTIKPDTIHRYLDHKLVSNITIKPFNDTIKSDVLLYDIEGGHSDEYIEEVLEIFNTVRRALLLNNGEVVAVKRQFLDIIETGDYSSFTVFEKKNAVRDTFGYLINGYH